MYRATVSKRYLSMTGAGVAVLVLFLAVSLSAQAPTQGAQPATGSQSAQQQQEGQAPSSDNNGVYVFRKQVEEVQLHATVLDDKHRMVTDLARQDFAVYENGRPRRSRRSIVGTFRCRSAS